MKTDWTHISTRVKNINLPALTCSRFPSDPFWTNQMAAQIPRANAKDEVSPTQFWFVVCECLFLKFVVDTHAHTHTLFSDVHLVRGLIPRLPLVTRRLSPLDYVQTDGGTEANMKQTSDWPLTCTWKHLMWLHLRRLHFIILYTQTFKIR